jgi:hypothetical protein
MMTDDGGDDDDEDDAGPVLPFSSEWKSVVVK